MSLYNKDTLKGDVFGGINAGIVALPAALGFGALAGLDPVNGLYGAIFLGLFAAIFGGTKTLISNPTGPMAVVAGEVVLGLVSKLGFEEGQEFTMADFWPYLFLIFIVAGMFQIVFGFVKLGKYVHYIPTPVISGFMSGIGVLIIFSQLKHFFGVDSDVRGTYNTILSLGDFVMGADLIAVGIASATMVIIYGFPKITKMVPSPLVAIVLVTAVCYFVGLPGESGKYLITKIPSEFPDITEQFAVFGDLFPMFTIKNSAGNEVFNGELFSYILLSGLYLAFIGMIDALLTAVVSDQLTKEKHNSDRELMGQGAGNIIAAMFGGMMGAGTTPATVLNIKSGGRSRLSAIIHALLLALILVAAAPIASEIPKAALAGLLITVGISILDFEVFKVFRKIPKPDNVVMISVLILTSFWGLMQAVAAGLIMAALIFMKKMADVVEGNSADSKFDRLVDQLINTFDNKEEFQKQVVVKNMRGPMFFGFASRFQDSIDALPDIKAVVLNFSGVTYMDQSGMYTLREAISRCVDRKINVVLSEISDRDSELLRGIGVIPEMVDEHHVFSSVEECVMWLNEPGHLDNEFANDDELYVPSAYTPNGDGINDEWEIRNIDKFPGATVKIYTREQRLIYESDHYMNEPWEGFFEGHSMPSDTYLYEIDLVDGSEVRKGKVTIFR